VGPIHDPAPRPGANQSLEVIAPTKEEKQLHDAGVT